MDGVKCSMIFSKDLGTQGTHEPEMSRKLVQGKQLRETTVVSHNSTKALRHPLTHRSALAGF